MVDKQVPTHSSPAAFLNRELSWLAFARRVLALASGHDFPLLERVKFAGIVGMLHDEFFMKRMSGLERQMVKRSSKRSLDGRRPSEEYAACRRELLDQVMLLGHVVRDELRPALRNVGAPIVEWSELSRSQRKAMRQYFLDSVAPILTPLAVDAVHPFPFISNLGLNLAVLTPRDKKTRERFIRIKVPANRPRWLPLPDGGGFVPLEQVIQANLDAVLPTDAKLRAYLFRVTRGAEGDVEPPRDLAEEADADEPGSIVRQVASELKARRFAGPVRLEVEPSMPDKILKWLVRQLDMRTDEVYPADPWLGISDLLQFRPEVAAELRLPPHEPVTHPRLAALSGEPGAIFREISRGDILLHHPYQSFDSSVLRFLESAAADPQVLAIKLTIYRTSSDSPIVRALADAARRGKQVAVLVEITARFDEAPNIAWGEYLEREGVHVAYGVERLKTHVKVALVVRDESGKICRYAHVGTGNYHTGTARLYEDVGILTAHPEVCAEVASVFNELTGAVAADRYHHLIVAPRSMRRRFYQLIQREAEHAAAGRPAGIHAKMNQLQDPGVIRELYRAGRAGVPILLNVRGLCCLRPQVRGLSENIRVFGVVGRFLEHSRIYRFENGGKPEIYIGSADWMKRNLTQRMETVLRVLDENVRHEMEGILAVYVDDNASAWDCASDGTYTRRTPAAGEETRAAQEIFTLRAQAQEISERPVLGRRPASS